MHGSSGASGSSGLGGGGPRERGRQVGAEAPVPGHGRTMDGHTALAIYLNDHLAGATGGLELFRRAAGSAPEPVRSELERMTRDVEQDRESLVGLLRALGVPVRRYKVVGGWLLEKAARAKPNGRLLRRSPLSDLVELEGLLLGVQGKGAGLRALRELAATDPRLDRDELDVLVGRAERQAQDLERLRLQTAARVLTAGRGLPGRTGEDD